MKIAKSPRTTMFLETVPLLALIGIAFGGSYGNILNFFGASGITGVFQYGDTACPDLLCLVAAREILRDRRIGRRKSGYVSWPMVVLLIGIAMTLTLGYIGADRNLLAHIAGSWAGHISGLLAGAVLLLVLSILHRRDTGTAGVAGTRTERRKASAGTAAPVPATSVPSAPVMPEPIAVTAKLAEGEARERSFDELVAEARAYRDELAAAGERVSKDKLRLRLTIGSGKALEVLRALKDEERSETAEEVV